ncbi:MAG: hypothetical protein H0X27_02625 [Caulobacteraceae bacterium]|nr:hypothetical protein [Caulobacteraceae bacterium]
MTRIHWLNPVKGPFTRAADWSTGTVPAVGDEAILEGDPEGVGGGASRPPRI